MKNIILSFVIILFTCISCTNANNKKPPIECKNQVEANLILVDYLFLKDESYGISISQEDAEKLGIPEKLYKEALKEISNTNSKIKKMRAEGIEFGLTDPQKKKNKHNYKIKNRSYKNE